MTRRLLIMFMTSAAMALQAEIAVPTHAAPSTGTRPDSAGFAAAEAPPPAKQPFEPCIILENGDRLHGYLAEATPDIIHWRHKDSPEPITFSNKSAARVDLIPSGPRLDNTLASVTLTNGDAFPCASLEMDTDKAVVETAFAGRLAINRRMIDEIRPTKTASERIVYELGGDSSGWKGEKNDGRRRGSQFNISDGVIELRAGGASVGRDVGLPDMAEVTFNLDGLSSNASFCVILYANTAIRYQGDAYLISISPYNLGFQICNNQGSMGEPGDGSSISRILKGKRRCGVTILMNKKKRSFHILVNGQYVSHWTPSKEIDGGRIIGFANDSQGKMKVSRLRINRWNGESHEQGAAADPGMDTLTLSNGDKISGSLLSVKNGVVAFKTEFADFAVPLERCASMRTADAQRIVPAMCEADVKAVISDESSITLRLKSINVGKLAGSAEAFGDTVLIDMKFITGIVFHPLWLQKLKEEQEKERKRRNANIEEPDDDDDEDAGEEEGNDAPDEDGHEEPEAKG